MITFTISLLALIAGYFTYGYFIEKVFKPDNRPTPAVLNADGVDFMVLPNWKIFMIQFLNIAGTGPIFGAIMGAWYGPYAYLWIVLGCIFAGAVHDYLSGMLSMRHNGANLPELIGRYLGGGAKKIMLIFSVFLLVMVGAVFVYSPALILKVYGGSITMWMTIIFIYYILATMLPIDKIIGRFYPIFAFSLLFMAVALLIVMIVKMPLIPELWDDLNALNMNNPKRILGTETFIEKNPLIPCLFLTIACGAISGFHATQSPLMARCMKSEKHGRPIFYGSMITEGIVALIWASVSSYFFYCGGWREVVSPEIINEFMDQLNSDSPKSLIQFFSAPNVVNSICNGWLGFLGGILAILGVVAAPITSGDTALRSARLIIAEAIGLEQRSIRRRLYICIPLFAVTLGILLWQLENPDGFNVIWQWFAWANQTLACFTLWAETVYLVRNKKPFSITLIPALFMTTVCITFMFISPMAFGFNHLLSYSLGAICFVVSVVWFCVWYRRRVQK